MDWHMRYQIPILLGDSSLIEPFLQDLHRRLVAKHEHNNSSGQNKSISGLVYGPGLMLFNLVILRIYLGRTAEDDDEIYQLVVEAADDVELQRREQTKKPRDIEHDTTEDSISIADALKSHFCDEDAEPTFTARTRITRKLTIPEQAAAALQGLRDTTRLKLTASYRGPMPKASEIHVAKSARTDIEARFEARLAYMQSPVDEPHVWPPSQSPGLTGGPPYQPFTQVPSTPSTPPKKPQPRPRPRTRAVRADKPLAVHAPEPHARDMSNGSNEEQPTQK